MIHNTKLSIIAAIGKNRELGKNGKMPWHISEDFKRFKQITSGHPVIMGRKTWESLPVKPLPGRCNIVITRDSKFKINDSTRPRLVEITRSLGDAIGKADEMLKSPKGTSSGAQVQHDTGEGEEIFVIGGGQIFEQAISLADKLYLTVIDANFDADTFFPDYSGFKKVVLEQEGESQGFKYKFIELER